MEKISTLNKILLFLYDELPYPDRVEMATILSIDREVSQEFEAIHAGLQELPKVTFLPSDKAISNIINYSTTAEI